jgi:queuosine precursor transporter
VLAQAGIADECTALPWVSLAAADYLVKLALAAIAIAPYGAMLTVIQREQRLGAT